MQANYRHGLHYKLTSRITSRQASIQAAVCKLTRHAGCITSLPAELQADKLAHEPPYQLRRYELQHKHTSRVTSRQAGTQAAVQTNKAELSLDAHRRAAIGLYLAGIPSATSVQSGEAPARKYRPA